MELHKLVGQMLATEIIVNNAVISKRDAAKSYFKIIDACRFSAKDSRKNKALSKFAKTTLGQRISVNRIKKLANEHLQELKRLSKPDPYLNCQALEASQHVIEISHAQQH